MQRVAGLQEKERSLPSALEAAGHLATAGSVCVFCGSNPGRRPEYTFAAETLAAVLVSQGRRVVYGGAHVGTMGALADAVLREGGEVVGVLPRHLVEAGVAHRRLSHLHVVNSMHERKALMAQLSQSFIALPGGLGTLEEFTEMTTWSQLGLHAKPTGLLNTHGYFDLLLSFLDNAVTEGFVRPEHRRLVVAHETAEGLLQSMAAWHAPTDGKWTDAQGLAVSQDALDRAAGA